MENVSVLLFCMPVTEMISLIVIIDDVCGWERLLTQVRYMFTKRESPLLLSSPQHLQILLETKYISRQSRLKNVLRYVNFQGICLAQHRFLYFWDVGVGRHFEGHCRTILWTIFWDKDEVTHSNGHGSDTRSMAHWKQEN